MKFDGVRTDAGVDRERRPPAQELAEHGVHLEAGEVRAEAEVRTDAEREVRVRIAEEVEVVGVVEHRGSRLAAPNHTTTLSPARICWSPRTVSSVAVRRNCITGDT